MSGKRTVVMYEMGKKGKQRVVFASGEPEVVAAVTKAMLQRLNEPAEK